jgi:N-acetylglucosamine-6-phosphate deacetylase
MGLKPAEHGRRPRLAISADRIFDGYRWHDDAVILIDAGVVQRVAPRGQSAGDWPTEVMPPGTVLAPGFIDLQVNGGGGILLNDEPTPDAMRAIALAHRRYGTTGCLPTLITDTRAKAVAAIAAAKSLAGSDGILDRAPVLMTIVSAVSSRVDRHAAELIAGGAGRRAG